jgi:cytoskeletal protein CcmA (bactofilin family)
MAALRKNQDEIEAPAMNVEDIHTILGPESSFEGKLAFEGTVRIDGRFQGEINTDNVLVIGESAHVQANMFVGSIIINGEVRGDITAKQVVEIHAPGKLYGNITTPQLLIERGVLFDGSCNMSGTTDTQKEKVTFLKQPDEQVQSS